jgi:hypothetical protein
MSRPISAPRRATASVIRIFAMGLLGVAAGLASASAWLLAFGRAVGGLPKGGAEPVEICWKGDER